MAYAAYVDLDCRSKDAGKKARTPPQTLPTFAPDKRHLFLEL